MTRGDLPEFEAPPINEVAMGVRFAPIDGLLLPHFGLYWSSLRSDFVKADEAVPLGAADQLVLSKVAGPVPRTWLIHKDEHFLIQLQPNLFFFNWRKLDEAQPYPRYATIGPLFQQYFGQYLKFLVGEDLPSPETFGCELTYVNVIPEDEDESFPGSFSGLFPDVIWRQAEDRFLPTPNSVSWQTTFDMQDDAGEVTAKVQSAMRRADRFPVLRFEISCRSSGLNLSFDDKDNWFDLAHRTIVMSFVDLTSDETQRKVWRRSDSAT